MSDRSDKLFLGRRSYRRRRLIDAARLLPVLGAFLFLVPLLWQASRADAQQLSLAGQTLYLFAVWLGMVCAAGALAAALRPSDLNLRDRSADPGSEDRGD